MEKKVIQTIHIIQAKNHLNKDNKLNKLEKFQQIISKNIKLNNKYLIVMS